MSILELIAHLKEFEEARKGSDEGLVKAAREIPVDMSLLADNLMLVTEKVIRLERIREAADNFRRSLSENVDGDIRARDEHELDLAIEDYDSFLKVRVGE